MSKTYSNKSNATRAARKAGLDVAGLVFTQASDGTWTFSATAATPLARPYRIVRRNPVREAARAAAKAAALEAAAKAKAEASKPKATPSGETPRHKDFSVYGRSALMSPVQYVHKFLNAKGKDMTRKEALYALAQAGVNVHTARTQYQRWFAANK